VSTSYDRRTLATERTLMAAERTYAAWVRTGLAGVGGGLAIARALIGQEDVSRLTASAASVLLVVWGAALFVHAIRGYRRTCAALSQQGVSGHALPVLIGLTGVLLVIAFIVLVIALG